MTRTVLLAFVAACHPTSAGIGAERVQAPVAPGASIESASENVSALAAIEVSPTRRALERVAPRIGAPVVLARDGDATIAYVADEDAAVIRVVDVDAQRELSALALPGRPAQLALLADGRLVATLRDRGELAVLAGSGLPDAPLAIVQRLDVAAEPIGLALGPDDRDLLVTSGWGAALTRISVPAVAGGALAVTRTWELAPEPRGVVVSDDGRYAFVSHAVGQGLERIDLGTGEVARIGMGGVEEVFEMMEEAYRTREACQGFALVKSIAPAGRIFAPQVLARTGDPSQPSEGYGEGGEGLAPEVFAVAILDEDRGKLIRESVVLRSIHRPGRCALPRAAAASARGTLLVTCLGQDAVIELDGASISPEAAELRRWSVPAGPVGIAIDDARGRAIVWSQHAHTLTTLPTAPAAPSTVRTVVLDAPRLPLQLARGRALFMAVADRRISGTGQACESCHPDGRQDALVWSSPNGPRQTPMLAGRLAGTAPYGWNGDARDVGKHLRQTFARLGGQGLKGEDLEALIAYVNALRTPVAPDGAPVADPAVGAEARALIAEGEVVFRSADAGCAACHGDDGRTPDGLRHNVGSRAPGDARRELDTPSLAFLAGSAPYYHDGRFATLRELLVKSRGKMGQARELSPRELDALEAYLRTR